MDIILQGRLTSFQLPDILTFLNLGRKSGTLTLQHGGKEARVLFNTGEVVYASANREQFRLGAILLRKRKISAEQHRRLERSMEQANEKYGELAVKEGLLSPEELSDFLKIQVSEIIYDCFNWSDGEFSFFDALCLPEYAVTISLDLSNLIMEGARRIDEWEHCLQLFPDKSAVFRVGANPEAQDKITLELEEWKILSRINGQRTLEELCRECDGEPLQIYRVLYGLCANKLIEAVPKEEPAAAATAGGAIPRTVAPSDAPETMRLSPFHATSAPETPSLAPVVAPVDALTGPVPVAPAEERGEAVSRDHTAKLSTDDRNLLISRRATLLYRDLLKVTLARLKRKNAGPSVPAYALVDPEYKIGRFSENGIQISDASVSGVHARMLRGPEGYVLEDLKSTNGTFINGARIESKLLQENDSVRFGKTEFVYNLVYEVKPPATESQRTTASSPQ